MVRVAIARFLLGWFLTFGGAAAGAWGYPGACLLAAASITGGLVVLEASGVSRRRAPSSDGAPTGRAMGGDEEGGAS